jgi:uncharacterized protein with FMN-binding domain
MGGAVAAVESSYMKRELVESNSARSKAIEAAVTRRSSASTPTDDRTFATAAGATAGILTVRAGVEQDQIARLNCLARPARQCAVEAALEDLKPAAGRPQHHGAVDCLCQGGRHHRRVGRYVAGRVRPVSVRRRVWVRAALRIEGTRGRAQAKSRRCPEKLGVPVQDSWSASRGLMAIPTAPSRSPCARAKWVWRSSMKASA